MEPSDSYQSNRLTDRLHVAVQIALVFLILAAVNYIGMRTFQRVDLTLGSQYSLSPETKAYLARLTEPVEIIVTLSEGTEIATAERPKSTIDVFKDVTQLLREYEYATRYNGENRVTVEYLDVYQQANRARTLGIDRPNVIVFQSGDRQRQVASDELYLKQGTDLREFLGENVFTRSILEVVESTEPVLYFTTGHGELDPNDTSPTSGASQLHNELRARNFTIRPSLDLSAINAVPDDGSLVVIAGPKVSLLPEEQLVLESYLNRRAGRLLVFLEPGMPHGLEDLFFRWGLLADDAVAIERHPNHRISGGDLLVRRFADHPITRSLLQQQITIVTDRAAVVREDPGRALDDSLAVTELLFTSDNSWGERQYQDSANPTFDPAIDLPPPVKIAAAAERRVDSSLGVTLPSGKLIAFGSSNFISNGRLQTAGNLNLALNAINFAIDRTSQLNIPPRPIRKVKLDLSLEQLHLARYLIWLGPPAVVGLFGMLVYLSRRN